MDIVERFEDHLSRGEYAKALPAIQEIVRRKPSISTSWFNYGICLNELGRPSEAASAFLKAFTLNDEDGGALYRACLALAQANEADRLLRVFHNVCAAYPDMIHNFLAEAAFAPFFRLPEFQALQHRYAQSS